MEKHFRPSNSYLRMYVCTATHLSLSARSIVFSAAVSLYRVLPSSVTISLPERYSASSSSSSLTRLRSAPSCWLAWSWLTLTCSKGTTAVNKGAHAIRQPARSADDKYVGEGVLPNRIRSTFEAFVSRTTGRFNLKVCTVEPV